MISRGSAARAAITSDGFISFSRRGCAAGTGEGTVIPRLAEGALRSGWGRAFWLAAGAVAVLPAAQWLRTPSVPYLAACAVATALALASALVSGARRRWVGGFVLAMAAFVVAAAVAQRSIARIDNEWDGYRTDVEFGAAARLERALLSTAAELTAAAERALDAPRRPTDAFAALEALTSGVGERGVVLFRNGRPAAWAGTTRIVVDGLRARLGASFSPFYLTLYATAERRDVRAVATALVHADPPSDRLTRPLDAVIAREAGVRGYEYQTAADAPSGFTMFASRSDTLFGARPAPVTPSEARLRAVEQAARRGTIILAIAIGFLLIGAWSRPSSLAQRLAAAAVAIAALSLVPLNPTFSSVTRLFDPVVYLAALGGPLTASVGALMLTSGLVLLGLLAVLRSSVQLRSRWTAFVAVVGIAALGPFLLRDVARGISPPPWGVTSSLWLAWEVALFVAGVAILLDRVSAGQALLSRTRGLPPLVAPTFPAVAAVTPPALWEAPGR